MINKNNLLAALKNAGYTGADNADEVKTYIDVNNINIVDADGKSVDVDAVFKAVVITVTSTAGEEVIVNDEMVEAEEPEMPAPAPMEAPETEMCDKPRKAANVIETNNKGVPQMFNIGSSDAYARKNYNRNATAGKTFFNDADEAEFAGAYFRSKIFAGLADGYAGKKQDLEIIGKTWTTGTGQMEPQFVAAAIQENLNRYGAARRFVGADNIYRMRSHTLFINDMTSDAVVSTPSEGSAGNSNASTPGISGFSLVATKLLGTKNISNDLLADSPLNLADYLARSFTRAIALVEDQQYFTANNAPLATALNGGIDTAGQLTSFPIGWGTVTDANITALMSLLNANYPHQRAKFVCSRNFFFKAMHRLQKAAGGVTLTEAFNGIGSLRDLPSDAPDAYYYGIPVIFSEVFNAVDGTQGTDGPARRPLLYGVPDAMAMGVVEGSFEIASSSDRNFELDVVTIRAKERFATHKINLGSTTVAGGLVVAVNGTT